MIRTSGEIFALHRVSDDPLEPGPYASMTVSPAQFEFWLASKAPGSLVSWEEIMEGVAPEGWALVTLDDGYRDTLEVVLPLLERYQAPALVFATVGFISAEREPFSARVARMMRPYGQFRVDGRQYDLSQESEFHQAWQRAYQGMDRGSVRRRTGRLQGLAYENGCTLPEPRNDIYMNWDELREIARHPLIEVGAHSWTHPRLSKVGPLTLWTELRKARLRLEQELNVTVTKLAYPHGANNYFVQNVARLAGYQFCFTTDPQAVQTGSHLNPYAIPRVSLENTEVSG